MVVFKTKKKHKEWAVLRAGSKIRVKKSIVHVVLIYQAVKYHVHVVCVDESGRWTTCMISEVDEVLQSAGSVAFLLLNNTCDRGSKHNNSQTSSGIVD